MIALDRRTLLAAAGLAMFRPATSRAASRKTLTLELMPRDTTLRPGQPATQAWRFAGDAVPHFAQGDEVDVTIANRLPIEVLITWRGFDGAPALEPLLARGAIAAGASATYVLKLQHAGTLICDARLRREAAAGPLPLLPLVVAETTALSVDRDEVLMIEDWRLQSDGRAMPAGIDPAGTEPIYTVNGALRWKTTINSGGRLRLRFINGAQRSAFAVEIPKSDVRVIAIDGQPSEPFLARDGRIVMAPGTRIDVLIDSVSAGEIFLNDGVRRVAIGEIVISGELRRQQPSLPSVTALPSNGLPDRLALQSALRVDLKLNAASGWLPPAELTSATAVAFRVPRGKTVVLALTNPNDVTAIFRLHGHHMRLLDRLDDGWKPFWLDTIAVPGKQTVRAAFAATATGRYLMETLGTDWASVSLMQSYSVDA